MKTENCHGCKWLDEVKPYKGDGYCAIVTRAKGYKPGDRVRRQSDARCELYCPGKFSERFKEADHED